MPLYHLLGAAGDNPGALKGRIRKSFAVSTIAYSCFALIVLALCSNITQFMTGETQAEVVSYLRWETIAFIVGHVSSFSAVVFVTIGKSPYIAVMTAGKAILTILADIFLIPTFGINGVAFSNIAVNLFVGIICFLLVEFKEFKDVTPTKDFGWAKQWVRIEVFSGAQILLDNLIYALIVCRMVNDAAEQGNYWAANNFIWSCLLIPITALA